MNYRKCPACKEQTDQDKEICANCNKAVLVFDFSSNKGPKIAFDKFRLVYGQVCGWVDVSPFPDGTRPKPPREWQCWIREPEVFKLE